MKSLAVLKRKGYGYETQLGDEVIFNDELKMWQINYRSGGADVYRTLRDLRFDLVRVGRAQ